MELIGIKNFPKASLAAGQVLFYEGDSGDEMYFIESGRIEISKKIIEGAEKTLAALGPGNYFGEMSILTGERRSATAKAAVDTELIVINRENFKELIMEKPELGLDIMSQMSRRIKDANDQLILTSLELALMQQRPQAAKPAAPKMAMFLAGSFKLEQERSVFEAIKSFEEKPKKLEILARFYRAGRNKDALIYVIDANTYDSLMELLNHFSGLITWDISPAVQLEAEIIDKLARTSG